MMVMLFSFLFLMMTMMLFMISGDICLSICGRVLGGPEQQR